MTLGSGGAEEAELRYKAFGDNRYTSGTTNTTFRFTGQREESDLGLYFYRSRWYDPVLGRFIQADTIVPDPTNPQSLNRYSYVLNNPLRYTDPSGHCPACVFAAVIGAAYGGGRVSYEASSLVIPGADRRRRDEVGGQLVIDLHEVVTLQSTGHGVDPTLTNSILRHEGSAFERRLLTPWPTMQPGLIANAAESLQSRIQGDTASIGPGQMQLRRAREL